MTREAPHDDRGHARTPSGGTRWRVTVRGGLLGHPATAAFVDGDLIVTPHRALDTLMGFLGTRVPLLSIRSVLTRGAGSDLVSIHHAEGCLELDLRLDGAHGLPAVLMEQVARAAGENDVYLSMLRQNVLAAWRPSLDGDGQPALAEAGFRVHERGGWTFGVMVLGEQRLRFLPLGGPRGGDEAVDLAFSDLRLVPLDEADAQRRICLAHDRGKLELIPFDRVGPLSFNRITGRAPFLRITRDGEVRAEQRPGIAARHPGGVAVILAGPPGAVARPGDSVRVSIGQPEGVYEFDSTVSATRSITGQPEGDAPQRHLMILDNPDRVLVDNLRANLRAQLDAPVEVVLLGLAGGRHLRPAAAPQRGDLRDLSTGGCAVALRDELAVGSDVDLVIGLPDAEMALRGRVVRAEGSPGSFLVAIEFNELDEARMETIHREVLARHRLSLAQELGIQPPTASALGSRAAG